MAAPLIYPILSLHAINSLKLLYPHSSPVSRLEGCEDSEDGTRTEPAIFATFERGGLHFPASRCNQSNHDIRMDRFDRRVGHVDAGGVSVSSFAPRENALSRSKRRFYSPIPPRSPSKLAPGKPGPVRLLEPPWARVYRLFFRFDISPLSVTTLVTRPSPRVASECQ